MFKEEEILAFWEKDKVFEKSVNNRKSKKPFIFYEGPPTANNVPHMGHFETRVFKDAVLRYKTMRGFFAPRRAGWDTHGLPVEVEVERTLGLKNKKDIERYGIAAFNKKCRESVWKYKELWEKLTGRMGFWIDMAHSYITYENSYTESLWGVIKKFADKNLLYEDYKVMPWCARCGTALSSHELAQGYEKIKEESIYIKFRSKKDSNSYFLVWTTTPWTLPGNVALAVNPKIQYVIARVGEERLVLAENRLNILENYEIERKILGSDLVGREYEALYPAKGAYKIVAGNFVSAEEGTGVVHIAPAFGDDDFQLSKKYNLPVLATTNEQGIMQTPGQAWNGEWFKKANNMIIENLKSRRLLFKVEPYEHDYPFCWRCKTPLMYFARKSWWVDVNAVRLKLLANNQKINWLPPHIKDGRMGEWLKEKKNWAFSRERFWGTPLPVWRCASCAKLEVIGSVEELKKRGVTSGNKYFLMRHGWAESNTQNITNGDISKNHYRVTPKGKKEILKTIKAMQKKKIKPDLIFTSPFLRTQETAELIAVAFGVSQENIKVDPRLSEFNIGGESLTDLKKRTWSAISEVESRYQNKTILIISHEAPLWMLWSSVYGKTEEESILEKDKRGDYFIKTGAFEELEFSKIPRDEEAVLNLHKPYIDEIKLKCQCGGQMRRVPEVVDVWFDSGAMPFASGASYPADYIVEAVDQTRGWFYTLLAVATLLGKKAPYKNVISLGHVLDKNGKKMSKSLGNVADPMALIEKYGADQVRWYFFTINQPWDSKLFREEDIKDASRRFFMILWNVLQFWKMYGGGAGKITQLKLLINKWVFAKLAETANLVTKKLDTYDIVGAARELENFIVEDISRWYVRRIRDVMKENSSASKEAGAVLAHLLGEISKLLAPFAPFISEKIWMELGNKNSVHLEDWPEYKKISDAERKMLENMRIVRHYVNFALKLRQTKNIKVRQPLQLLTIDEKHKSLGDDYLALIKEEVNVKEIAFSRFSLTQGSQILSASLSTEITPELKEEGILRDLIREIQAARKTAGLKPKDKVAASLGLPKEILAIAKKHEKVLIKETNLKSIQFSESAEIKVSLK